MAQQRPQMKPARRTAPARREPRRAPKDDLRGQALPLLWQRYRRLIDRLARRFARRLRGYGYLSTADLRSAGYACLGEALQDDSRRATLGAYLLVRLRGAMIDALRTQDPLSRELRSFTIAHALQRQRLTQHLQRPPESDEIAAALRCDLARFHHLRSRVALAQPRRLRRGVSAQDLLMDYGGLSALPPPDALYAAAEQRLHLRAHVRGLPPRLSIILETLYFNEVPLCSLARDMGISPARVSQLHAAALLQLRAALQADMPPD